MVNEIHGTELADTSKETVKDDQKKYGRSAIDREALIANGYSQNLPRSAKAISKTDPNKWAGSC